MFWEVGNHSRKDCKLIVIILSQIIFLNILSSFDFLHIQIKVTINSLHGKNHFILNDQMIFCCLMVFAQSSCNPFENVLNLFHFGVCSNCCELQHEVYKNFFLQFFCFYKVNVGFCNSLSKSNIIIITSFGSFCK